MRVAMTGASGFLGGAIAGSLIERGDEVTPARRTREPSDLRWDPVRGFDPDDALSGFDAVVHLAGENVAGGRWTDERKERIRSSRIDGTRAVVRALEQANPRPRVLVCASAIGIYGDTGSAETDESDAAGDDFLARVCVDWEAEADVASKLGVRVVKLRTGFVLGRAGGALAKMVPAFRLGLGGRLGTGEQFLSWIHLDDFVAIVLRALDNDAMTGAYNMSAPNPVDNRTFTRALGKALRRPTWFSVPEFALRAAFGELSEVMLGGQRAVPKRLLEDGYRFRFTEIDHALGDLLG